MHGEQSYCLLRLSSQVDALWTATRFAAAPPLEGTATGDVWCLNPTLGQNTR